MKSRAAFVPSWCLAPLFAVAIGAIGTAQAGERLSSEDVRDLLVGNTVHGKWEYRGTLTDYWEFHRPDGRLKGRSGGGGGSYQGKFEIRDDGCVYVFYYEDDASTGCYYYERLDGGGYRVTGPGNWSSEVEVLEGDPKRLD